MQLLREKIHNKGIAYINHSKFLILAQLDSTKIATHLKLKKNTV